MDNKKIDRVSMMNDEIKKRENEVISILMKDWGSDRIDSGDSGRECRDVVCVLMEYLHCCIDNGYCERSEFDKIMKQFRLHISEYLGAIERIPINVIQ